MIFLGIESSCDETSVGVVKVQGNNTYILANKIITQLETHKKYGGVVPEIAAREHVGVIDTAIKDTLKECNVNLKDIDVVASTQGPGLVGGLLVGSVAGKALAIALQKPFLPINHLHGHALSPLIENNISFPYLLLLISGGNCLITIIKNELECEIIGQTIDDAPGEAFDKVARMLGLGYPGGPIIEKLAKQSQEHDIVFPTPLKNSKDLNLSFSGLKTAVLNKIQKYDNISSVEVENICNAFQKSVANSLAYKIGYAIKTHGNIFNNSKVVAVAGGVSANNYIASVIQNHISSSGFKLVKPSMQYCVDNGAMIAYTASKIYSFNNKILDNNFLSLKVNPRWSLEGLKEFYLQSWLKKIKLP